MGVDELAFALELALVVTSGACAYEHCEIVGIAVVELQNGPRPSRNKKVPALLRDLFVPGGPSRLVAAASRGGSNRRPLECDHGGA